ncbi:MAG: LysE family translocator [SAR86 cluster bacterium]|jgi:threonine/homoserine/homoserine lactone efflux protein|nr:LysE family translocator [SAR86 cluster bacterium]|tara:strand:- start:48 stop:659 length:612 start_codon:yes stop_codon:yes gene_type:complete
MEFLTVAILHLFAVASPGPDFALVTRQSLRYNRKVAIWTSLGIGVGILFHSLLAITGLVLLITSNELFSIILKIIGSLYLLYLGVNSILGSKEEGNIEEENTNTDKFNGFLAGLITNITNIKAILFFVTVFSVVIDTGNNLYLLLYGAYMALATFVWFSIISFVFTSEVFKSRFSSFLGLFEKIIGFTLILLSLQILIYQISI